VAKGVALARFINTAVIPFFLAYILN